MGKSFIQRWIIRPHPIAVGVVLVLSLLSLWHFSPTASWQDADTRGTIIRGTVTKVLSQSTVVPDITSRTSVVQELIVEVEQDDHKRTIQVHNDITPVDVGDGIYVNALSPGTDGESFNIVDVQRTNGLVWLFGVFCLLVLVVSGFKKGFNALVGMVLSVAVIFSYAVPALLAGHAPLVVGMVAALAILAGTFYVSYGFDRKSLAALIGIVVTLLLVAAVAQYSVSALHFTGYGDESAVYLNQETDNGIQLVGLLIAGIIIAAIGVLDDVAITQASTVYELAQASSVRGWKLFAHAMRVGTDHISAVINTLVLAYAGASLPLILLLHLSHFPLGFSLGGEMIAQEVLRTIVSSMGLVLAVPLTTAVAVWSVQRWGVPSIESHHHH